MMMKCSGSSRQEISDFIVTVTTATPAGVTGRSGYRDTDGISGLCSDTTSGGHTGHGRADVG